MYLTADKKKSLFKTYGFAKADTDTGSPESQIALFTDRITHLTAHLKVNAKDFNTKTGLLKLVGKRRSLLDYLQKTNVSRYRAIVAELQLRK